MILVIAPLLPLRTGIATYSHKLYSEIGKHYPLLILANKGSSKFYNNKKKLKIIESWDYNQLSSFIPLTTKLIKNKKKLLHFQLGYTWIKNPLTSQILTIFLLLIAKLLLRMKIIVTLHGIVTRKTLDIYFSTGKQRKTKHTIMFLHLLYTTYYKLLVKTTDIIIVHNLKIKRKLIRIVGSKYKKKILIIPHGVDTPPSNKKITKLRDKEKVYLLFTGFIRRNKGIEEFIEALNLIDEKIRGKIKVIIAGSPHIGDDINYYTELKAMIKKYKLEKLIELKIKFIPENELNEIIQKAEVIILPYKDYFYEASGVLARIMGYEKAVICTNIPKFSSELKNGEDAIIIPPGDKTSLVKAIETLVTSRELRLKLAHNLRKKGKLREWEKIAQKHIKLYLSLTKLGNP